MLPRGTLLQRHCLEQVLSPVDIFLQRTEDFAHSVDVGWDIVTCCFQLVIHVFPGSLVHSLAYRYEFQSIAPPLGSFISLYADS